MPSHNPSARSGLLPTTHYFVSISRGDSIRTAMVRPALLWGLLALAPLSLGVGAAGAGYFALHDTLLRAALTRAADIRTAYEARLDAARGRLEETESRRLIEGKTLEDTVKVLFKREARLEEREQVLARLAAATGSSASSAAQADALSAIRAASPQAETPAGSTSELGARAYAPAPASPALDGKVSRLERASDSGAETGLDKRARVARLATSLDAIETGQIVTATAIGAAAAQVSAREAKAVLEAGLDPAKLTAPMAPAPVGGPFVPLDPGPEASAFDRAAARSAVEVATGERLRLVMPFLPFLKPLLGESPVSSPFGYRIDPFLGRPALHAGVDLLQDYGAEVRAAAAGRVVHAGPMGGYGTMVEIDHGNGLSTRYGHLSETQVAEGEEVAQGALIGRLGTTGRSTGPHLHYEVRINGDPIDPERFLTAGQRLARGD